MRTENSVWIRVLTLLSAALLATIPARAQDARVVIELNTNAPYASVYADDALLGRASQRYFSVPAGSTMFELVLAGKDNWSIPPVAAALEDVQPGDTLTLRLDFPYRYRFESTPFGAHVSVAAEERLLGSTPLEVTVDAPLRGGVKFELDGYWPEEIVAGQEIWNVHAVRLQPVDLEDDTPARVAWTPPNRRKKWIDYAALGTAAVAGVVAVHYKFKADRRYDRYRESGNPALRSDVKRYDVYSGVALGVMQAGVGLFAIRLVFR